MSLAELAIEYPDLPVAKRKDDIVSALREHQVVVVVGETGSGKTTQLPKMALELARQLDLPGKVGCTQPRRLAASSVSKRVAEELKVELGTAVGYKVRFTDQTSPETQLKFMTDGILLAETQGDPLLNEYHTIIIDEAHERSLNIDFLLGLLRNLLSKRADLRVIISSATLDAGGFVRFYGEELGLEVPLIEVEGRTFPVEERYLPPRDNEELTDHVARAVDWISSVDNDGDVLVFLPGEREIRECADVLEGRRYHGTDILPLFARLGLAEQQRIFNPASRGRRIVLATNVAETSLTIPGIIYVIDSGLARVSRYSPARQLQRLQIEPISQASARQRKGRCGRVTDGICIRLYDEEDFEARDEFTDPEIRRSSLAGVILRMASLHLPPIDEFPLVDPPASRLISEGYRTLREIGAMTRERELTDLGWEIARLPVDPRLARMLIESLDQRCAAETLILVTSLSLMDVRERPMEKKAEADRAQKLYEHSESDFFSILKVWSDLQKTKGEGGKNFRKNQLRKLCRERFLNFRRVIEWDNLVNEVGRSAREVFGGAIQSLPVKEKDWAHFDNVHKALLAGAPKQFGKWFPDNKSYKLAGGGEFAIFPGSGLFNRNKRQPWLLAMELVETNRVWARRVAKLNPLWVEEVAPHLCSLRYASARWDEKQGAVYATEIVMCGGLELGRRSVHFGRIDPTAAREVFIREALLGGGLKNEPQCIKDLRWLEEEVGSVEQKLRRPGGLWSDELVLAFFEEKIPKGMSTAKAFWKWYQEHEDALRPALEDVIYERHAMESVKKFPDVLQYGDLEFPLYYNCEPGARDDGVTIGVHVDQLPHLPPWLPQWGVPGDLIERVRLLIKGLPKSLRTQCNPAQERAESFAAEWLEKEPDGALVDRLAEFLTRECEVMIGSGDLRAIDLPDELVTKIWVCDDEGSELALSTNLTELQERLTEVMRERFEQTAGAQWERTGMKEWACGELPYSIEENSVQGFPSLVDEGDSVGVKVFADRDSANESHRAGCVRLLLLHEKDQAKFIEKKLPLSWDLKMFLPTTGAALSDLVRVGAELALRAGRGGELPRDPDTFEAAAKHALSGWFPQTQRLARSLGDWLVQWRAVQEWIEQNEEDRNLGEVADDLKEELNWLMRPDFLWRAGAHLADYEFYFQAMTDRLERLDSLPLAKDLEKMDTVRELWAVWFTQWDENPEDVALWEVGWKLENYRASLFAPNLQLRDKVSAKQIRKALEELE